MESFVDAWNVICEYCKQHITDVAYKTWISRLEPYNLDFNSGKAFLLAPNEFHRQTLERCYTSLLNDAFSAVFGENAISFEIIIPEEKKNDNTFETEADDEQPSHDDYSFDSFIVGSSNKFAHAAALAVATNPAGAYNPLFIYGNSGLGKTHLMSAIGNEIDKNLDNMNIIYVKGDDFTNELIDSLKKAKMADFRNKYRKADVLLVDDVQFIGGKDSTQEEFFHTFNALYDSKKQIVLTSDRPPKEIKTLEDRLRTRFEWGLIADIQPPDLETRIAIIKRKAEQLDLNIPNDVCDYMATKLRTNIRQLEGAVKKMKAKFLLNGEKPTITTASEAISDILNNEAPPELTVDKIIDEVSRTFSVPAESIRLNKSRKSNISNARHIAIYITRQLTNLTVTEIGEKFGGKHYSTIVYSIKQIDEKMEKDSHSKEMIEDIIKNIRDR